MNKMESGFNYLESKWAKEDKALAIQIEIAYQLKRIADRLDYGE